MKRTGLRVAAATVLLLTVGAGLWAQSAGMKHGADHGKMVRSERDFVEQMVFHHQEAIDTAVLIAETTEDAEVRQLAEAIVASQSAEVLALRRYFARWYGGLPSPKSYKPMMRDLNKVSGPKRTVQFVQDMTVHHEGAVAMSQKVLTLAGIRPETRELAQAIVLAQNEEIAWMRRWLEDNAR
jgi:uncharacterized protein (DUF305 family)